MRRHARVLSNDPVIAVMCHVHADYDIALDCACENGLNLPGLLGR